MFLNKKQRSWFFSSRQLAEMRQKAVDSYQSPAVSSGDQPPWTVADDLSLQSHYLQKLKVFISRLDIQPPPDVIAVALTFFKRFYLKHSCVNYHPRDVMLLAFYVAAKSEEFVFTLHCFSDQVCEQMGQELDITRDELEQMILNMEIVMLDGINFHLMVPSSFRALSAQLAELDSLLKPDEVFERTAFRFVDHCFNTDVVFCFTHTQIALAGIMVACETHSKEISTVEKHVSGGDGAQLEGLRQQLRDIRLAVDQFSLPSAGQVGQLEQKLLSCYDRANDVRNNELFSSRFQQDFSDDDL